jgi:hypothetical protein
MKESSFRASGDAPGATRSQAPDPKENVIQFRVDVFAVVV